MNDGKDNRGKGNRRSGKRTARPEQGRRTDGAETTDRAERDGGGEREVKIYGENACRALFARRFDDVLRAYLTAEVAASMGEPLHHMAAAHRPYRIVTPVELERLSDSKHHEGICVVARRRIPVSLEALLVPPGPAWLVALAEVANPHNVGAIVRTAAHFGARGLLLSGADSHLTAAGYRTAEGGAEAVEILPVSDLGAALATCKTYGFAICATSSHARDELFAPLPARAVVLLGAEAEGLPKPLLDRADRTLCIPGSGAVESLNVSVAASVVLAELWRQHGRRGRPSGAAPPKR